MEFETRYRENVNTKNIKVGMLRVPSQFVNEMQKDAQYKVSVVKTAEPKAATQGRPSKTKSHLANEVEQPTQETQATTQEQPAPTPA